MTKTKWRLIGGTLLILLGLVTWVSLYAFQRGHIPDSFVIFLVPGTYIAAAARGGIHGVGDEAYFLNILFWVVVLGVSGLYCFLVQPKP